MGGVLSRAFCRVELVEAAQNPARRCRHGGPRRAARGQNVAPDEIEQRVKIALHDLKTAVHIGFAQRQFGIEREPSQPGAAFDANAERLRAGLAIALSRAVGLSDVDAAFANGLAEPPVQLCLPKSHKPFSVRDARRGNPGAKRSERTQRLLRL